MSSYISGADGRHYDPAEVEKLETEWIEARLSHIHNQCMGWGDGIGAEEHVEHLFKKLYWVHGQRWELRLLPRLGAELAKRKEFDRDRSPSWYRVEEAEA